MSRRINKDFVEQFHDYDLNVQSRTVTLFSVHTEIDSNESGVEAALAARTIKNLSILESINLDPITIILNTPGGDWYHGMAIYDAIKACKSQVTIKGIAQVMSMGAVIMQAADVRLLYPNAKFMIHYGHNGFEGHSKTTQKWAKEFSRVDKEMENIFLEKIKEKHPDFQLQRLKKMLDHDTILNAKETVVLGLVDGIVGEEEYGK